MKKILSILLLCIGCKAFCSPTDSLKKPNPIIYAETFIGISTGRAGGVGLGLEGNYQFDKSLFSARYVGSAKFDNNGFINPFIPIPDIRTSSTAEELALLYGYRKVMGGNAFSISGGISRNKATFYDTQAGGRLNRDFYLGFPIELNFQFFKKYKKRMLIYGIIPIGKPTGFGPGISLKFIGNISRNSYAGFALSYGLGYFKKYDN